MTSIEGNIYNSVDSDHFHRKLTSTNSPSDTFDINVINHRLLLLWAEVLQDDPQNFTDEDIFFEVGGDSRSAQSLVAAAQKQGILLTIQQVFNNPSLEEMSEVARVVRPTEERVENALEAFSLLSDTITLQDLKTSIATKCNITPLDIQNAYPCTPMQESLLTEIGEEKNAYVRQFVFKLADDVSMSSFKAAWTATIEANPVLRTRICYLGAKVGYVQVVIDQETKWETHSMALDKFLDQDENATMAAGDPLARYSVVLDADGKYGAQKYFIWTIHHAICDGTSITEILHEVAGRYRNESVIERQAFDLFVKHATMSNQKEEQEFWRKALSGKNPTPYPQPPQNLDFQPVPSSTVVRHLNLEAPPPFGVTKSILLRAAWAILSSHLTGTEEVVFGLINNGRNLPVPGVAQITGPTINLVPLVLQIDSNQKVRSFLSQVQQQAVDMMAYESSGISKIRKYLAGEENTTMDFQTLLVVQPMEFSDAIETSTTTLGLEYIDSLGTKEQHSYPLVVTFTLSTTTTLKLEVQHDTRVVSTKQAENLTYQLQKIISQLSQATEDDLVGSVTSLSEHDIHQIRDWNKNTPPPEKTTIHHLFRRQVLKQPDSPAVCDLENTFSYRQVDEYSSYLAAKLAKLGIAPGDFVGVCFEKSIWTVVAILAVFKAGGVYVPLDPAHPHARILEVINTVQIGLVVASAAGAKLFEETSVKVVTLDDKPSHEAWTESPEPLTDSTAYLLFTSGTTGKPKGILMSHFAICTSIIHHGTAYGAGKHWRTLQFGAHTFDLSIGEFFTTLAFGGCICVPSEHERMNNLAGAITSLNVNTLLVVPTVANLLFPKDVPTLKTIVLAGEPITKETIVRWADHVDLTAGYGPSETAVYCSGNLRVSSDAHPAHIGKNIGATMWIVNPDNYHELSAVGCIGEIVISGPLLGQGYFNDKATTEAAFVPAPKWMKEIDPMSEYNMLYRSGDLAKYNDDGSLHIVGRRDTQVKLRGFRIELGEIENQIMAYGSTSAVLAHLPKEGPCAQQIVVVLSFQLSNLNSHANSDIKLSNELHSSDTEHKLGLLKQHLAIHLPGYMVPTIWIVLDRMPLLISGKIDRKALKTWVNGMEFDTYKQVVQLPDTDDTSKIVPGSTADILRKIWSDVLSVPSEIIGLKTSFFALGGDSIAAIQIVTRAKNVGLSITVRGIIRGETLEHLVALTEVIKESPKEAIQPSQDTDSIAKLLQPYEDVLASRLKDNSTVQVEDAYPLAPFQREIMRQRAINPDVFIISWQMEVFHLSGPQISLERLAKAWNHVVQKFPVLRSIYLEDSKRNGESLQVVLTNAQPEIVISSASEDEIEPTFETAGTPHIDECFLPHRAHFIKHGNRYFVHIELDHRTIDGWSLKLIKTALLQAYENEGKFLAQQPVPYKAFVSAHDQNRAKDDDEYWVSVLKDQRPSLLSFPVTSEKIEVVPSRAKTIIYLPEITSQGLTPFSVKNSITYASIFNAAWAQTLSTYTQSQDAAFEYIISGREEDIDGVFDIVGPLINALPLHLRDIPTQHDNGVLAHLAHQIQEQQAQDGLHSSSNVREVIETHLENRPLFNTALNFQRRPTAVELGDLKVDDDLRKSSDPWHFDVLVRVLHITDDATFKPSLEFYGHKFDKTRMQEVAEDWWQRVNSTVV